MDISPQNIAKKDNYNLSFALFKPVNEIMKNITILISLVMAVLQEYYRTFSEFLWKKGYNVITVISYLS